MPAGELAPEVCLLLLQEVQSQQLMCSAPLHCTALHSALHFTALCSALCTALHSALRCPAHCTALCTALGSRLLARFWQGAFVRLICGICYPESLGDNSGITN